MVSAILVMRVENRLLEISSTLGHRCSANVKTVEVEQLSATMAHIGKGHCGPSLQMAIDLGL